MRKKLVILEFVNTKTSTTTFDVTLMSHEGLEFVLCTAARYLFVLDQIVSKILCLLPILTSLEVLATQSFSSCDLVHMDLER